MKILKSLKEQAERYDYCSGHSQYMKHPHLQKVWLIRIGYEIFPMCANCIKIALDTGTIKEIIYEKLRGKGNKIKGFPTKQKPDSSHRINSGVSSEKIL